MTGWQRVAQVVAAAVLLTVVGCSNGKEPSALVTLKVHVGLFGGPSGPRGGMALSDAPQSHSAVTVVDFIGDKQTARTDSHGVATFGIRAGRYEVRSASCGNAQVVTISPGRSVRVEIRCDIP